MSSVTRPTLICAISLAVLFASSACSHPVVIERLVISPSYVCTGESIHFDWSIRNINANFNYRRRDQYMNFFISKVLQYLIFLFCF